eukprot:UN09910
MFLYGVIGRFPYDFSYESSFEEELADAFKHKRGLLLDHHGMYTVGKDAADAFFVAYHLHQARSP